MRTQGAVIVGFGAAWLGGAFIGWGLRGWRLGLGRNDRPPRRPRRCTGVWHVTTPREGACPKCGAA